MLKIDRSAVDKAIEDLEMFTATKKVLSDYEIEKKSLENRGEALIKRAAELQEQHSATMIDREVSKDNPSDYIYLSKELTQMDEEMKIILTLQEQLKEDFTSLKMKYAPIIQATYSKDLSAKNQLPVNDMVEYVRYELVKSIYDFASEVRKQQSPLLPAIGEFLDDKTVMDANRGFGRLFEFDQTNLYYSEFDKTVIHRMDIFSACSGNMPTKITNPKGSVE